MEFYRQKVYHQDELSFVYIQTDTGVFFTVCDIFISDRDALTYLLKTIENDIKEPESIQPIEYKSREYLSSTTFTLILPRFCYKEIENELGKIYRQAIGIYELSDNTEVFKTFPFMWFDVELNSGRKTIFNVFLNDDGEFSRKLDSEVYIYYLDSLKVEDNVDMINLLTTYVKNIKDIIDLNKQPISEIRESLNGVIYRLISDNIELTVKLILETTKHSFRILETQKGKGLQYNGNTRFLLDPIDYKVNGETIFHNPKAFESLPSKDS